jgi:hypothetical protein
MGILDREQLEAMRRQIEEDYRLDIAAVERLQRRCLANNTGGSAARETPPPQEKPERNVTVLPSHEPTPEPQQPDELTASLRGMFSTYRR